MFGDARLTPIISCWPGKGSGSSVWMTRSITSRLASIILAVFLPMRDEASEDEMTGYPNHLLSPCGSLDSCLSWLFKGRSLRCILGLHPRNVLQDIPVGKNPSMTKTFENQFFKVYGNYPMTDLYNDLRITSNLFKKNKNKMTPHSQSLQIQ